MRPTREMIHMLADILVKGFIPGKGAKINLMGKKGGPVKWKTDGTGFKLSVPESLSKTLPSKYAIVFKVSQVVK